MGKVIVGNWAFKGTCYGKEAGYPKVEKINIYSRNITETTGGIFSRKVTNKIEYRYNNAKTGEVVKQWTENVGPGGSKY